MDLQRNLMLRGNGIAQNVDSIHIGQGKTILDDGYCAIGGKLSIVRRRKSYPDIVSITKGTMVLVID